MKIVSRLVVFLLLSAVTLYLMYRYGFLDFSYIADALTHGKRWVFAVFLVHVALAFCGIMRYFAFLKVFAVESKLSHAAAASLVSTAVGQWAPGSLAVMELLRVGLMIGADKHAAQTTGQNLADSQFGIKARLAAASLFDRLLGFCLILTLGSLVSFFLLLSQTLTEHRQVLLAFIGAGSLVGAVLIMSLPALSKARWPFVSLVRLLVQLRKSRDKKSIHVLYRVLFKSFRKLNSVRRIIAHHSYRASAYLVPTFWSVGVTFSTCLALYYSALAIDQPISLLAILAVLPVMAVSSLFPIGFAGVGGQQLIAIALFDIFSLNAASVASASLLQNIIYILVNTILGLLFAHHSATQIRAIIRSR